MVNEIFFEEMTIGRRESVSQTVTAEMVETFAKISGDINPLHLDADYAATTRFGERIAHGALTASFISAVLGTKLPGIGAVYIRTTTSFLAPVTIGDKVDAVAEVTHINPDKNRVTLETGCFVGDKKVVTGEAIVYVPNRPVSE